MDSLQNLVESIRGTLFDRLGGVVVQSPEVRSIRADLLESDDAFLAVFDAPGTTSSDVQVQLSGRTIEVRIDRFRQPADEFELTVSGRGMALDGEVKLPGEDTLAGAKGKALLRENGTLEVRIPKRDGPKPDSVKDIVDQEFYDGYENESTSQVSSGDTSTDDSQKEGSNGDFEQFETKSPSEQETSSPDTEQPEGEDKDLEEIKVSEEEDETEKTDEGADTDFEELERPGVSNDRDDSPPDDDGEN